MYGTGPDARSAYRAAWRELRLRRHDPAELRREIAELRRALGHDLGQALERLNQHIEAVKASKGSCRRARHVAAIRAHRALLAAQRERYEESLRACRRSLIERTKERGDLALGLAAIRQEISGARQANSHVAYLVPDVSNGGLLDAVRVLLKLAAGYAEMHRRATAAETRAAALRAGQDSLLAAARRAGFEYTVRDWRFAFEPASAQNTPETSVEPSTDAPTGGETPSDRAQDAPNAEQSA